MPRITYANLQRAWHMPNDQLIIKITDFIDIVVVLLFSHTKILFCGISTTKLLMKHKNIIVEKLLHLQL